MGLTLPPTKPLGIPWPSNPDRVASVDPLSVQVTAMWLAGVRRNPTEIPFPIPLTATTAPSGTPRKIPWRVPAFCKRVQWGICATGEGVIYLHAQAAPASETYRCGLRVDKKYSAVSYDEGWTWSARDWPTPTANGDPRPFFVTSSVEGKWEDQVLDLWIVDEPTGSVGVRLYALALLPVPRVAADGTLV